MEPDTTNQEPFPAFGFFQMIGAPKEVDSDTSETSSYCSSRNPDSDVEVPLQKPLLNLDMLDDNEPEDDHTSTYNKFKT